MNVTLRDRIATLLVATSALVYGLWLVGPLGSLTTGSIAIVVLILGILASASAVVPGFMALLHGSKTYLAIASLLGLAAFVSGLLTVVNATESTLAILVIATVVLWAAATVRHAMPAGRHRMAAG